LQTAALTTTSTPNGMVANIIQSWNIPLNKVPNLQTTIFSLAMGANSVSSVTAYTLQDTKMIISYTPVPTPPPPTPKPTPAPTQTPPTQSNGVETQNIVSSGAGVDDDGNTGAIVGGI